MKKRLILKAVHVTAAVLLIAAVSTAQLQQQDGVRTECSATSKEQYYQDFLASNEGIARGKDQALEAAKKYLACPEDLDQEKLAKINLAIGQILIAKKRVSHAIPYLIKAASYNSSIKTSPRTYADLAEAYLNGPYAEQSADYRVRFEGKDESDASRLALENIFQLVDRIIDAYARAVALAGIEPPKMRPDRGRGRMVIGSVPSSPSEWMEELYTWYTFRHGDSAAGLKELIGTILSQPLPSEPTPITTLPPSRKVKPHRKR